MNTLIPTKEIARKVLETVDCGLVHGQGEPVPGQMCVEAAVCFALGLPHGDNPPCVGSAVRSFKIRLNDSAWSSDKARAKGMRKLAIAQLGSNEIDQKEFAQRLAIKTTQRIVPIALRAAASLAKAPHKENLEAAAKKCEAVTDLSGARAAAAEARDISRAASESASAYASAYASASESASESASASASESASESASASASESASESASASAYAYASASASESASESASASAYAYAKRDEVLTVSADIGLEVLVELNSPGCQWLDLCEVAA